MIKFINSWVQGIILAVIIATIIEIILPDGKNKKYIKTIIGIYILFAIIYPIISKISNKTININSILESTTKEMGKYENIDLKQIETNSYVATTYQQKLEEDITKKLEDKGYNIDFLKLYVETEEESRYGQINTMVMQISKTEQEAEKNEVINRIEEVKIDISNSNTNISKQEEREKIKDDEIQDLKEYLNTTYQLEIQKIHINE